MSTHLNISKCDGSPALKVNKASPYRIIVLKLAKIVTTKEVLDIAFGVK